MGGTASARETAHKPSTVVLSCNILCMNPFMSFSFYSAALGYQTEENLIGSYLVGELAVELISPVVYSIILFDDYNVTGM